MINQSTLESYKSVEDLVERAKAFAKFAHAEAEQLRKYTDEPYIVHPEEVARTIAKLKTTTPEMIAAAWLHDVVEDTRYTIENIEYVFGEEVAGLVLMLTEFSTPEDGNRAERKAIDRAYLANVSPEAQTIKLADLIDNTQSIFAHDKEFAKVYLKEKQELLEVMNKGNKTLHRRAMKQVKDGLAELEKLNVGS